MTIAELQAMLEKTERIIMHEDRESKAYKTFSRVANMLCDMILDLEEQTA